MTSPSHKSYTIPFRVLGYWEEGKWVALALEMDLRGYGESFEDALEELQGTVAAQVSFAFYKQDLTLLDHKAEERYFEMFQKARDQWLQETMSQVVHDFAKVSNLVETAPRPQTGDLLATTMNFPDAHIIASQSKGFALGEHG